MTTLNNLLWFTTLRRRVLTDVCH